MVLLPCEPSRMVHLENVGAWNLLFPRLTSWPQDLGSTLNWTATFSLAKSRISSKNRKICATPILCFKTKVATMMHRQCKGNNLEVEVDTPDQEQWLRVECKGNGSRKDILKDEVSGKGTQVFYFQQENAVIHMAFSPPWFSSNFANLLRTVLVGCPLLRQPLPKPATLATCGSFPCRPRYSSACRLASS